MWCEVLPTTVGLSADADKESRGWPAFAGHDGEDAARIHV
jgi:hypothetical protein